MSKVTKTLKIEIDEQTYNKFVGLAKMKGLKVQNLVATLIASHVGREMSRFNKDNKEE